VVECFLAKEDVAGSTPVSRSKNTLSLVIARYNLSRFGARYPSGKGEVCKTFMRRFDPDPRLHKINNFKIPPTPSAKCCGDFCGGNLRATSTPDGGPMLTHLKPDLVCR
jgi:hypothetical protein